MKVFDDHSFPEISSRLRSLAFPSCDAVIGLLPGGLVPSIMVTHQLRGLRLSFMRYATCGEDGGSEDKPMLRTAPPTFSPRTHRILLVDEHFSNDDIKESVMDLYPDLRIITFALWGRANIVAFPEIENPVIWPWTVREAVVR